MVTMKLLKRWGIDPYLLALLLTVALAVVLPARGAAAPVTRVAVTLAVGLLFFLYGARLSTAAVVKGMANWRLQALVLACTYLFFPLVGIGLVAALHPWLPNELALGLLFVCVLPSTVQSSIAFTAIARGSVPAALCSASLSNLIGVVVTPLLVGLLLHSHGPGFDARGIEDIALQLLLPFGLGQLARPFIGGWLARHARLTGYVDRGSILLVVYAAFGESVVSGLWSHMDPLGLALVLLLDLVLLAIVLVATTLVSRLLGFSKEDEIAIVFCGSKKSLASGVPMANILFPAASVGAIVVPLMLFHQAQLFVCAALAQRYGRRQEESLPAAAPRAAE